MTNYKQHMEMRWHPVIHFSNEHVTIFQSALYQTTSTVIETDDFILIVDPAWLPGEIQEIRNHVNSLTHKKERLLLFTHGDFDHIIGCNAFPEATTIGSIELRDHPEKAARLKSINDFDTSHYIKRDYPVEYPKIDIVIDRDAQQIQIGSGLLTFYKAPGHTNDGLFTIVDSLGIFLCGDYLSDFELPFIYLEHGFLSSFTDGCHRENVSIIQKEYLVTGEKP